MAAEAAISTAVNLLGDLLIQKVKFLGGVEGEVELLIHELRRMQCFLEDANRKQVEDKQVCNWISEIREVAQDTEDAIEMFLLNVAEAKNRGFLERCSGFWKRISYLDKIGDEIKSIRARLEDIDRSRERYGIRILEAAEDSTRRSEIELRRRLSPWGKDEHLVGVEDDVKKVLRESILNEEKKGLSVALIHGMGGIGKSTLAREIYNHRDVAGGGFECRGWVVVSNEFTPRETMKQLILELPGSDRKKLREVEKSSKDELYLLQKLQEMLHRLLQGKNYLIVLDDVWETKHWEYLENAFPSEQDKTSRLLITSRNEIITKYDQYKHEMRLLDPDQSWELLLKNAFTGNTNRNPPEELESVGKQILEKCGGLPLAISVVGGLLVGTHTKSGWERVLHQINSYLGRAENNVLPILELSYQNLPPQLKPCFLCLAFFKEDSIIEVEWLVNIWAAQGLIHQEGSCTMDEIARGYLNELINRSLLQIQYLTIDDRVQHCRLHDLLRDVCLSKAEDEMDLKIVKEVWSESSYKPRHVVVYGNNLKAFPSKHNKHLRSLFLLDVRTPSHDWKSFQHLKILNVEGFVFRRLPHSFRFLLGLKLLRLYGEGNANTLQLPGWFDHLKKLEVFEVDYVRFPNVGLKMESLRQFGAVEIRGSPMIVEKWENVETLRGIRLEDCLEIRSRTHLREVSICIREREGDDVINRARVSLEKMTNLEHLRISISDTSLISVDRLIPNLDSLTKLELASLDWCYICPEASVFPPNLSYLTLGGAGDDPMEELAKLPKLQYLMLVEIHKDKGIDWRMKVLHDGFPCLKVLALRYIPSLRGIDIEEGGLPHLKKLEIYGCVNLQTENLPKHIVISSSTSSLGGFYFE